MTTTTNRNSDNWNDILIFVPQLSMTLQTKLQTTDSNTNKQLYSSVDSTGTSNMKVLQRPQSLQENSSAASALSAAPKQLMIAKKSSDTDLTTAPPPVMMVLHKSSSEYDAVNYATPINNQTVKILRRPAQAEERRDTNGIRPKQPIKTLQQREQEYAQARLRILGSAKNPEDDKPLVLHCFIANLTLPRSTSCSRGIPIRISFNFLCSCF